MTYSSLANSLLDAVNKGINNVVENQYSSIWSEDGAGWQEIWKPGKKEKPDIKAGIYASCEGIILLINRRKNYDAALIEKVYKNHLCKVFDEEITVQKGSHKYSMREKCMCVTYKMAHFINASSFVDQKILNKRLLESTVDRLLGNYKLESSGFSPVKTEGEVCILSTVESLAALNAVKNYFPDKNIEDVIKSCLKMLYHLFKDSNNLTSQDKILIIWTLSNMPDYFADMSSYAAKECECLLKFLKPLEGGRFVMKFFVTKENKDYYSANTHILLLSAAVNFLRLGYIDKTKNKFILESMLLIKDMVDEKGFYSTNKSFFTGNVEFWENFRAIELLKNYQSFIDTEYKTEEKYMVVEPDVFKKTDFNPDDMENNLVFVIMPFKPKWSEVVMETFRSALPDYNVRRADSDAKGDPSIMQNTWELINKSKFVIAEITGSNPNVFYELGIAHTLGKDVFICAQKGKAVSNDIPFDIQHLVYHIYDNDLNGPGELTLHLRKFAEKYSIKNNGRKKKRTARNSNE